MNLDILTQWRMMVLSKYVKEIMSLPNLTEKETEKLISEKNKGKNYARETLIKNNLKLAISLAKQFEEDINLSVDELINIGSVGLIKAVDTYDGCNHSEFRKCMYLYIKNSLDIYLNALNNQGNNLYGNHHDLEEKTVQYNEDTTFVEQEISEDEVTPFNADSFDILLKNFKPKQYKKTR